MGSSQSGQDISLELVEVAKETHISTRSMDTITEGLSKVIKKHQNLHLQPQVRLDFGLIDLKSSVLPLIFMFF